MRLWVRLRHLLFFMGRQCEGPARGKALVFRRPCASRGNPSAPRRPLKRFLPSPSCRQFCAFFLFAWFALPSVRSAGMLTGFPFAAV
jgi:hypothetical protein